MITDHEDGPASGKFTKTFMKRDYVIKFMNRFVNGVFFLCHDFKTVISRSQFQLLCGFSIAVTASTFQDENLEFDPGTRRSKILRARNQT